VIQPMAFGERHFYQKNIKSTEMNTKSTASGYFRLSIEAEEVATFEEVSGIGDGGTEVQFDEGGENTFKHYPSLISKHPNLVLKRGVVLEDSKLIAWFVPVINADQSNKIETHTVTVSLLDLEEKVIVAWIFKNACPLQIAFDTSWTQPIKVFINKIELTYSSFTHIVAD